MKILFINPPYTNFEGIEESGGHLLPLSFGYLAAYARERIPELEFEVLDCEAEGLNYEQVEERLKNTNPDVIGITAPTPPLKHVYKISEIIKRIYPDSVIVAGGIHPTVLPKRTMIEGKETEDRPAFSSTGGLHGPWPSPKKHNVFSLRYNGWKIIKTPDSWELYDIIHDPLEENNIIKTERKKVATLKRQLHEIMILAKGAAGVADKNTVKNIIADIDIW